MNSWQPARGAARTGTQRSPCLWSAVALLLALLQALFAWPSTALAQAPGDDKLVLSGEYVLAGGETLGGHLTVTGGSAALAAGSRVGQDVVVFGGELRVAGTVVGGLTIFGGSVTLADSAVVEGDLAAFGGALTQAPGAIVQGEVFASPRNLLSQVPWPLPRSEAPTAGPESSTLAAFVRWQAGTLGLGLTLALLAVGLVVLFPRRVGTVVAVIARRPFYSGGAGLLTLVVGLLAGGLLLIACGLGLLVWLVLLAALLCGWSVAGTWLGHRLLGLLRVSTSSAMTEAVIGVFLLTLLARLPLGIGFLVGLAALSVGVGAVVLTRFGGTSDEMVLARRREDGL